MKKLWICGLLVMAQTAHALAQDDVSQKNQGAWYLQASVYTDHYSSDPEHIRI